MRLLVLTLACFLFCGIVVVQPCDTQAQEAQRKVVNPPAVKSVPRDFTRPQVQRPAGFGKQEWQKPQQSQQPQVRPSYNYRNGGVIIGRHYVNPYFHRTYGQPVIRYYYGRPVIIYPQPVPVYPAPFHGFFFHFRW